MVLGMMTNYTLDCIIRVFQLCVLNNLLVNNTYYTDLATFGG